MKTFPAVQRPILPVLLIAVLCLLQLAAVANVGVKAQAVSEITTVFLVRHAEKAAAPREDPPLAEEGVQRSKLLARLLGQAGIKTIYTSQYLRTKQTANQLAAQLGITPTVLPISASQSNPREVSKDSIKMIVDNIYQHAGESVLIIGHSNSIPEVIRALKGDVIPVIDEQKFDDLFIVTIYRKEVAKVVHLKY
jgi:phosphohistidine phosphatase SixA